MNEIVAVPASGNIIEFEDDKVELIKRTIAKGTSDDQLALFLHQCQKTGLDPLARQIYCVLRWNTKDNQHDMSIQTAIDGYRLIADRTNKYAGSDDYTFNQQLSQFDHMEENGNSKPITATVTVYKIVGNQRVPFTATAAWVSYYPGDGNKGFMWRKMPYLMLGKCAEALALRKAFPAELSGVYVREEMEQAGFVDAEPDKELLETALAGPTTSMGSDNTDIIDEDGIEPTASDNGNEPDESAACGAERVNEWRVRLANTKNITVGTLASVLAGACPERWQNIHHATASLQKRTDFENNEGIAVEPALEIYDALTSDALAAVEGET